MPRAQLARIPDADGRRAERRMVNLAASLREPGATVADVEVLNLSLDGFMAEADIPLEVNAITWLKLAGMEAMKSRVVWIDGDKAGFQFTTPLHASVLEQLVAADRKPIRRNHFGPRPLHR